MNEKIVIKFDNVTKRYKLYKNDKSRLLSLFCKNIKCKENKAVNDVSFTIKKENVLHYLEKMVLENQQY